MDFCWHRYSSNDRCKIKINKNSCDNCNIWLQQIQQTDDFIYVGSPKCGSSSIHLTIGESYNKNYNSIKDLVEFIPIENVVKSCNDNFSFTFVRNPWSRVLSCWNGWVKDKQNSRLFQINGIHSKISFSDFVKVISIIDDKISDQHFVQLSYMFNYNGHDYIDFYGKVENMSEDWLILKDKFNLNDIKHSAKTNIGNELMRYYNEDTIKLIEDRYKDDIIKFNYNKNEYFK